MKRTAWILSLTFLGATCANAQQERPNRPNQDQPSDRPGQEQMTPAKFIEKAACSGKLEVKLGEMASQKAENPEVKQFAQRMVADHTKANQKLMALAQQEGVEIPKEMPKEDKAECDKLENADSASFDREYMKCMVKGHKKSVALLEKGTNSENEGVKAFATATLPTIKQHYMMAKEIAAKVGVQEERETEGRDKP